MTYSTGRGGAGNIHSSMNITSDNNYISPSKSASQTPTQNTKSNSPELSKTISNNKRVYYSTGRGGAGNIQSSDQIPSPKLVPMGSNTPQLTTNKITTGRGGYGNMVDNDSPQLSRKLQDVDGPPLENDLKAIASNKSFLVGRGGFGNVISNSRSNASSGDANANANAGPGPVTSAGSDVPNLYTISSRGDQKDKKKPGFLSKIKEIFGQ